MSSSSSSAWVTMWRPEICANRNSSPSTHAKHTWQHQHYTTYRDFSENRLGFMALWEENTSTTSVLKILLWRSHLFPGARAAGLARAVDGRLKLSQVNERGRQTGEIRHVIEEQTGGFKHALFITPLANLRRETRYCTHWWERVTSTDRSQMCAQ